MSDQMKEEFKKAADGAGIASGPDRLALWAWWMKAWQASRAALCIELPDYHSDSMPSSGIRNAVIADCKSLIQKTGVRVK